MRHNKSTEIANSFSVSTAAATAQDKCGLLPLQLSGRAVALLMTLLLALATPLTASAKDFQIEVVLFENMRAGPAASASLYVPRLDDAIGLTSDKAREMRYQLIDQPDMLIEYADRIKSSADYRLLRHFAWRQPGLDANETRPIRVNVGSGINVYIPEQYTQYDRFVPAARGPAFAEGSREISTTTVSGILEVRLGRFLHLDARLVFTDPDTGRSYRLDHNRKMRSRELHYIDNPKFGMLVRIIPLDDT